MSMLAHDERLALGRGWFDTADRGGDAMSSHARDEARG